VGLKRIAFALIVVSMSATGFAADVENAKPLVTDGMSTRSDAPSYFEGVWVGKWPWGVNGVEFTITVGKRNENGMYGTGYSWETGQLRNGRPIAPGSLKTWGKEQGDKFLIEWKNKEGAKSSITLVKGKEDSVKAIYDTDGPFIGRDMSDRQAYLKRR
jgi:hypothetical protein